MIEPAEKTGMRNAWGRVAIDYDELWAGRTALFTETGLDLLDPPAGATGLDIGCGPGHTAAALARRVSDGAVVGVDFAPAMVERARERWSSLDQHLTFDVDDAERLSRPDAHFDVVTSSFTLMYCYDALAAVGHVARVLRPGGRTLLLVWGPHHKVWWSPVIDIVESRAAYYSSVCPMMFYYGLPGVLSRMLEQMELTIQETAVLESPMHYLDVNEAVSAAILAGPLAGLFQNRLDEDAKADAWREMTDHVTTAATSVADGITLPASVLAIVARKPE
jgi:ubiquinone/menaquinone biosynthesis C-methylase UbiE